MSGFSFSIGMELSVNYYFLLVCLTYCMYDDNSTSSIQFPYTYIYIDRIKQKHPAKTSPQDTKSASTIASMVYRASFPALCKYHPVIPKLDSIFPNDRADVSPPRHSKYLRRVNRIQEYRFLGTGPVEHGHLQVLEVLDICRGIVAHEDEVAFLVVA